MRTITVAELRQNPTSVLNDAADGVASVVTKHGRVVARIVPPVVETWVPVEDLAGLFEDPDPVWAAEVEAERDRDRLDPDV